MFVFLACLKVVCCRRARLKSLAEKVCALVMSAHMASSTLVIALCLNLFFSVFVSLRCGESPADTQPTQCHDLPKKQLCSQCSRHLCWSLSLSTVPALWSQLRPPACCHGWWCHALPFYRQHSEGSQVSWTLRVATHIHLGFHHLSYPTGLSQASLESLQSKTPSPPLYWLWRCIVDHGQTVTYPTCRPLTNVS